MPGSKKFLLNNIYIIAGAFLITISAFYVGLSLGKSAQNKSTHEQLSPTPIQQTDRTYIHNPQNIALMFYQDHIQFTEANNVYTSEDYPFNTSIFLTDSFKNNHPNFMCAANIPKNIVIKSQSVKNNQTAEIILEHQFENGNHPFQVNMIYDNLDGRWKIDSTKCIM
jgi:antitoxin component YwqK of YwqJK toxin-antitoxin module